MSRLRLEVVRIGNDTKIFIDGGPAWNARVTFPVAANEEPSAVIEWPGDIEVDGEIELKDPPAAVQAMDGLRALRQHDMLIRKMREKFDRDNEPSATHRHSSLWVLDADGFLICDCGTRWRPESGGRRPPLATT